MEAVSGVVLSLLGSMPAQFIGFTVAMPDLISAFFHGVEYEGRVVQ